MVGIETQQLLFRHMAVGARCGWDQKPAQFSVDLCPGNRENGLQKFCKCTTYCPIRCWDSGDGMAHLCMVHPSISNTLPDQ
eukprot:6208143-Pleurochrysis_carterae.AAC.1